MGVFIPRSLPFSILETYYYPNPNLSPNPNPNPNPNNPNRFPIPRYLQLLKQRLTLIRELHEARNSNDPAKIRMAIETAESFVEVDVREHIDFSKQTLHALEEHERSLTLTLNPKP